LSYYSRVLAGLRRGRDVAFPEGRTDFCQVRENIRPEGFTPVDLRARNIEWADDLYSLYKELQQERIVKDIIVHGSYGDFSQTGFSDLELTLYLQNFHGNASLCKAIKTAITKVNRLILSIDPLQHHGPFFIWDDFLQKYDEDILPLCAYSKCWSFSGTEIPLMISSDVDSLAEKAKEKYISTLTALSGARKHYFRGGFSLYKVKRFMSNLFMVPVFYYQARGLQVNKKEALRRIRDERLPPDALRALDLASHMRSQWPEPMRTMSFLRRTCVRSKIPQGHADSLLCSLFFDRDIASITRNDLLPLVEKAAGEMLQSNSDASR